MKRAGKVFFYGFRAGRNTTGGKCRRVKYSTDRMLQDKVSPDVELPHIMSSDPIFSAGQHPAQKQEGNTDVMFILGLWHEFETAEKENETLWLSGSSM